MKYLEEMADKEIIEIAKEERIFLGLIFDREKIIEKLWKKGYKKRKEEGGSEKKYNKVSEKYEILKVSQNFETENDLETVIETEEKFEEIYLTDNNFSNRNRSYYRNYPNKKLFRKLKKRYRFKNKSKNEKELFFNYRGINKEEIRKRETETEINKSKYSKGAEYGRESETEDIFFDKAYLPSAYFVDEIVLMPKNPTTLFAYWEIRDDTFTNLTENNNEIIDNIIIKLFKDGQEYKKIVRHERIGSHYISEVDANDSYEVFVGYEDKYGNFSEIAHSGTTLVPSDKLSDNLDLLWGTVKEDYNTNQIIKYVNSPIPTPENIEFMELSNEPINDRDDEFVVEILERLMKVGASENLSEREVRKSKPDRLVMTGVRSS